MPSVARRPFFVHLPGWIYASPEYDRLTPGERWAIHAIATSCRIKVDDESIRGCFCGEGLLRRIGCCRTTFWGMQSKFRCLGFVMKLSQGGGRDLGNELGIPGRSGALDHLKVDDDPRYKRPRKTVRNLNANRSESGHKPFGIETKIVQNRDGKPFTIGTVNAAETRQKPPQGESPLSSSYPGLSLGYQGAPTPNGQDGGREGGKSARGGDDDDALRAALRDSADRDEIFSFLNKRLGIGRGRARKQALHPQMTPALVRLVAAKDRGQRIEEPGAYFGNLIAEALLDGEEQHQRHLKEKADEDWRALEAAEKAIDDLPADKLRAIADEHNVLRDVDDLHSIRTSLAFRKEIAQLLVHKLQESTS